MIEAVTHPTPVQATVLGEPYTVIHSDLFIPPDALEVLLDSFSGPLDLLLYLIRRQNIDIMNIPIVTITRQYLDYIALMKQKRLELAADYLLMAAMLAEIKSRMLLPQIVHSEDDVDAEEDPRMALVRRLQEYEKYKYAATEINALTHYERDVFHVEANLALIEITPNYPELELSALVNAMQMLLIEKGHQDSHSIQREVLSVRERMAYVLQCIAETQHLELTQLFAQHEGRMGLVVSLLAILELAKQTLLSITQIDRYDPIYIKAYSKNNSQNERIDGQK